MSTTTTEERITVSLAEVREGDLIAALDDVNLGVQNEVTEVVGLTPEGTLHIKVWQDPTWITSPDRYLSASEVTVIREVKAPRKATRTIKGIKWVSQGDRRWLSEDGQWTVEYVDDFETECEHEHPVKITRQMREAFFAASEWDQDHRWDWKVAMAIREGRKGYMCYGGEVHFYGLWVAGAVTGEPEVIIRDDTFEGAASAVARHIETGELWD
jgi:hypothetical protein